MATSTQRFAAVITTNPKHFGYDHAGRQYTDHELFEIHTSTIRGGLRRVYREVLGVKNELGSTYHRVVIKNTTSGEFLTWDDMRAAYYEAEALRNM